jgi:multidrug transporter EmrE-like cation transporter
MLYVYVAIILLCETTAIGFLKKYSQVHHLSYLLLGLLCYGAVSLTLVQSFGLEGMGMVNVLWSALSVIFVESVGVFEFHERVTHRQMVGMVFAIAGIAILRFQG